MDDTLVERIAATFTDDTPNPDVQITLPGVVVQFLINWAAVGQERADADPDVSALLGEVIDQVDLQIPLPVAGDLTEAMRLGRAGVRLVNPRWTRLVDAFIRARNEKGATWTPDNAEGYLRWLRKHDPVGYALTAAESGVEAP